MTKRLLIFILILFVKYNLKAVFVPVPALGNLSVNTIFEDSYGYLWLGTNNGLYCFDGFNLQLFRHNSKDPSSISLGAISCIFEDHEKIIWIGTYGHGLNRFDRQTNTFEKFQKTTLKDRNISDNNVNVIYEDSQNRLWIGTGYGGLNIFDRQTGVFKSFPQKPALGSPIRYDGIMAIMEDSKKRLWIGKWGLGLNLFNPETGNFKQYCFDSTKTIVSNAVWAIHEDLLNNIWVSTWGNGFKKFDPKSGLFVNYSDKLKTLKNRSSITVLSIIDDPCNNNKLLLGLNEAGMVSFDTKTGSCENINLFGPGQTDTEFSIEKIIFSQQKACWLIGNAKRVWMNIPLNPQFNNVKSDQLPSGQPATILHSDNSNSIWVVFPNSNGTYQYSPSNQTVRHFKQSKHKMSFGLISAMVNYSNNAGTGVLISSFDGIYLINAKTLSSRKIWEQSPKGHSVISNNYQSFNLGKIWITDITQGIVNIDLNTGKIIQILNLAEGNIKNDVSCLFEDSKQNLWQGTELLGLYCYHLYENNRITHFKFPATSINSNYKVTDIYESRTGQIWVGTSAGLFFISGAKIEQFKNNELEQATIRKITEDTRGNIWTATNIGLFRISSHNSEVHKYDALDGLNSNDCFSITNSSDGHIVVSGNNGLITFDPINISKPLEIRPKVILTGYSINSTSLKNRAQKNFLGLKSKVKQIVLKYSQRNITIDYVALYYPDPGKVEYACRLENFDKDWILTGQNRNITYPNLLAGKYIFRVKARVGTREWVTTPDCTLTIIIKPLFVNTWYFKFLAVALILILVWVWFQIRTQRLRRIKTQLNLKVKQRTAELQKKNEELQRKNLEIREMAEKIQQTDQQRLKFFQNISHEIRTPLSLISGPLETLMENRKGSKKEEYLLMLMKENADRLLRVFNQILHINKIESGTMNLHLAQYNLEKFLRGTLNSVKPMANAKRQQINLNNLFVGIAWFDAEKLETIILNLLHNAIKYTPEEGKIILSSENFGIEEYSKEFENNNNTGQICLNIIKTDSKAISGCRYAVISIKDTGIGIDEDELPKIFERFYQSPASINGIGIGLELTRELLLLHHASIKVKSIKNKGSEFKVFLPVSEKFYTQSEKGFKIDLPKIAGKKDIHLINEKEDSKVEEIKPLLLLVEDDEKLRGFMVLVLKVSYKVLEASNGEEGFKLAYKYLPDLVLSDVIMPVSDGIEMCKRIKADGRTCHIPVILLTAKASEEAELNGLKIGADGYITKPFSIKIIKAKIKNLIESRRNLWKQYSQNTLTAIAEVPIGSVDERFIKSVLEKLEQNFDSPHFGVEELSALLSISRVHLFRKIKSITGQNVSDFIRIVRLKKAAELLRVSNGIEHIANLAYQVGFDSPSYFTKCFKEQFGVTPTQYIQNPNNSVK